MSFELLQVASEGLQTRHAGPGTRTQLQARLDDVVP